MRYKKQLEAQVEQMNVIAFRLKNGIIENQLNEDEILQNINTLLKVIERAENLVELEIDEG